jgi:hypothetical protein
MIEFKIYIYQNEREKNLQDPSVRISIFSDSAYEANEQAKKMNIGFGYIVVQMSKPTSKDTTNTSTMEV